MHIWHADSGLTCARSLDKAFVDDDSVHILLALSVLRPQSTSHWDDADPLETQRIPQFETSDVICRMSGGLPCS